jgi:uncharacterized membrane protein YqjE
LPAENGKPESIAATVTEVSERVTLLIRDEIELAKVEVTQKVKSLTKGVVWFGIAAGLGLFGVLFIPVTIAWVLDAIIDGTGDIWVGFAIVTGAFLLAAGLCALLGIRKVRVGAPTPDMAIDEARKIRETVTAAKPGGGA